MNRGMYTRDAQQAAMSFLIQQATYIEAEVYRIQYPDIQYPSLVPVDNSAPAWTKSITYFSMDKVGKAGWFHQGAKDIPLADVAREMFEETVEMAAIGYRYDLAELAQAQQLGINLPSEKAEAAVRAYEEFCEDLAISGDTTKNKTGLINNADVAVIIAPSTGTNFSPAFADKTAENILKDVNDVLTGVFTASNTIEIADTVLLPISVYTDLATKQMPNLPMTVLEWLQRFNVYSQQTGQPILIRGIRGLDTAGTGSTGRMVAYRRDPRVLKFHIPMPHMFLPVYQTGPLVFDVPGIFRVGSVEVRRPGAMRYLDNIINPAYE